MVKQNGKLLTLTGFSMIAIIKISGLILPFFVGFTALTINVLNIVNYIGLIAIAAGFVISFCADKPSSKYFFIFGFLIAFTAIYVCNMLGFELEEYIGSLIPIFDTVKFEFLVFSAFFAMFLLTLIIWIFKLLRHVPRAGFLVILCLAASIGAPFLLESFYLYDSTYDIIMAFISAAALLGISYSAYLDYLD